MPIDARARIPGSNIRNAGDLVIGAGSGPMAWDDKRAFDQQTLAASEARYGAPARYGGAGLPTMFEGLQGAIRARGAGGAGGADPDLDRYSMANLPARLMQGRSAEGGLRALRDAGLMPEFDPETASLANSAEKMKLRQSMQLPHERQQITSDMADRDAISAGNRYYMPEVAGPREDQQMLALRKIFDQYIRPAEIKAQGDQYVADQGLAGHETDAMGRVTAAQMGADARDNATMGSVFGNLHQYPSEEPDMQSALRGLMAGLMRRFNTAPVPPTAPPIR